jgi:TP901 family phage tail tape measure protein
MEFLGYLFSTQADVTGARQFEMALKNASMTAKKAGHEISQSATLTNLKVKNSFNKQGQIVKKYTGTIIDGNKKMQVSWTQTGQKVKNMGTSMTQVGQASKTASMGMNDFTRALQRVAIVVPVWFLFRNLMMSVFRTISDGAKYFIQMESWLARAQAVTSNASVDIGKAMEHLKALSEDYARKHKGTAKEVIEAYYRMATSGLDFADAITGSIPAVKLANSTYGDVAETAKAVSAIYRLLGDNIQGAVTKQEKMEKITDVLSRAWANHEVEMNQLAQAIANVGGQAKSFGLDMTELIAVLSISHDVLIKGGRAGRLFGRSLDDMAKNLPAVEKVLGETFNPKTFTDWFSIFEKLVQRFREMGKTTPQIQEALTGIFNIRAKRQLQAIVAIGDKFSATLKDLKENSDGMTDALAKIADVTPEVQFENLSDNLNILMRQFFDGAITTQELAQGIKDINDNLEEMELKVVRAGAGVGAFRKNLTALWVLIREMNKPETKDQEAFAWLVPSVITSNTKALFSLAKQLVTGNREAEKMVQTFGEMAGITDPLEVLQKELKEGLVTPTEAMARAEAEYNQKLQDGIDLAKEAKISEEEALAIKHQALETQRELDLMLKEEVKIKDNLVSHELDLLKMRGATASEVARTQIALKESLGLYETQSEKLKDQLNLEKKITGEMLTQKGLSSDSIKLWEIASRYGTRIATEIGEVLTAQRAISDLSRKSSTIFQKQFSSRFAQFKAKEYFFGGRGAEIPIPERTTADVASIYQKISDRLKYDIIPNYNIPVSVKFNVNMTDIELRVKMATTQAIKAELRRHGLYKIAKDYNGDNIK